MKRNKRKFRSGFSLVEMVVAIAAAMITVLVVGVLLVSGVNSWQDTYYKAHRQIEEDATAITVTFGSIGRMSNRSDYVIYSKSGSNFTPVVSGTPSVDTVVSGDAVEFRYWDVPLDTHDTHDLINVTKTATAYALFYPENGSLKIDYGPYPPGGVPAGGGGKNTPVRTVTLARNVSTDPNMQVFSHTMLNGAGKGCVRVNAILTDPNDGTKIKVMTSVFMRNTWPR